MTDIVLYARSLRADERAARRAMIDYIAGQMAYRKGRTWTRMTEARREQMRHQVRACLQALCYAPSTMFESEAFIAVAASQEVDDGADASTVADHAIAYLREVLR